MATLLLVDYMTRSENSAAYARREGTRYMPATSSANNFQKMKNKKTALFPERLLNRIQFDSL